jgi:ABC-type glycerol-3-phosphate transport system substrate-binding protein
MQASYPDVEYFSFPVPGLQAEGNPAYGVTVWELSIVANNEAPPERRDLAWDFLEWYFMSDEHTYLLDAAEVVAAVPSKIKLQSDPRVTNNAMAQALVKRLDRMVYMGDEVQGITTMLQRYVDQSLVQGGEDLETVVQGMQTEGDQVMQEKDYWILERDYKYADEFQG